MKRTSRAFTQRRDEERSGKQQRKIIAITRTHAALHATVLCHTVLVSDAVAMALHVMLPPAKQITLTAI
jgi:hypothetical protein